MIDVPKNLVKAIQNGQAPIEELTKHLSCQPMNEILTAFAELILLSEDYINRPHSHATNSTLLDIIFQYINHIKVLVI